MLKNSKKITVVDSSKPLEPLDSYQLAAKQHEMDTNIQADKRPQPVVQPVVAETKLIILKAKRVLTQAQKDVLALGRAKARETINNRNATINAKKQELDEVERRLREAKEQEFEQKIIKKALSIKKKEIKRHAVLDEISDDDTNIEEIKAIKKRAPRKAPADDARSGRPTPTPTPAPVQRAFPKITFV